MSKKKWDYDGSIYKFPIQDGEVWSLENGSKLAINNLYNGPKEFMKEADLIFVDPPWNKGNVNSFYTKADIDEKIDSFDEFLWNVFKTIDEINPKTIYFEFGCKNFEPVANYLKNKFKSFQMWKVVYYNKYPCLLMRGGEEPIDFDYTAIDEAKCTKLLIEKENFNCIGDFCMGRGNVADFAYQQNKKFVGTELNRKRLAVAINKVAKQGGTWSVNKDV